MSEIYLYLIKTTNEIPENSSILSIFSNQLIVGVVAIVSAIISSYITFFINKKSFKQKMITTNIAPMRQEWINKLRYEMSRYLYLTEYIFNAKYMIANKHKIDFENQFNIEYVSKIMEYQEEWKSLEIKIDLLLPISRKDKKEKLADKIRYLMKSLKNLNKKYPIQNSFHSTRLETNNLDKKIDKNIRHLKIRIKQLLKEEWDVTKNIEL